MKNLNLTSALILSLFFVTGAHAAVSKKSNVKSLQQSLDTLGANKEIADRAKAIDAENRLRVVQNRTVDRRLRLEFGVGYDGVTGGDSYVSANNVGYLLDFHITPQFSIGARYYDTYTQLTDEGKRVFDAEQARRNAGDLTGTRPDVDYPLSSTLGVVTFYPLYGKLNFFNLGITQFDVYVLGGYGEMKLQSGNSPTWTAGGGVGIWWSQHFTTRLEARYQAYEDKIYSQTATPVTRDQEITTFSIAIGFML